MRSVFKFIFKTLLQTQKRMTFWDIWLPGGSDTSNYCLLGFDTVYMFVSRDAADEPATSIVRFLLEVTCSFEMSACRHEVTRHHMRNAYLA